MLFVPSKTLQSYGAGELKRRREEYGVARRRFPASVHRVNQCNQCIR